MIVKIVVCNSMSKERSGDACVGVKHLDDMEDSMFESLLNCIGKCLTLIRG